MRSAEVPEVQGVETKESTKLPRNTEATMHHESSRSIAELRLFVPPLQERRP